VKRTSNPWVRLLCAIALIDATLLGSSHAELVADKRGDDTYLATGQARLSPPDVIAKCLNIYG